MKRTLCPPGPRPIEVTAQPKGAGFYALRSSEGDWTTGYSSEWSKCEGCLRVATIDLRKTRA